MSQCGTGIKHVDGKYEYFYRAMSRSHYESFLTTGRIPATTETFISPTQSFSTAYDGVMIKFQVREGTTASLGNIGVRAHGTRAAQSLPDMPLVKSGWGKKYALFKPEGEQINIGLGKGAALDIFNKSITGFEVLGINR